MSKRNRIIRKQAVRKLNSVKVVLPKRDSELNSDLRTSYEISHIGGVNIRKVNHLGGAGARKSDHLGGAGSRKRSYLGGAGLYAEKRLKHASVRKKK